MGTEASGNGDDLAIMQGRHKYKRIGALSNNLVEESSNILKRFIKRYAGHQTIVHQVEIVCEYG